MRLLSSRGCEWIWRYFGAHNGWSCGSHRPSGLRCRVRLSCGMRRAWIFIMYSKSRTSLEASAHRDELGRRCMDRAELCVTQDRRLAGVDGAQVTVACACSTAWRNASM
jgi:hypothetical protein